MQLQPQLGELHEAGVLLQLRVLQELLRLQQREKLREAGVSLRSAPVGATMMKLHQRQTIRMRLKGSALLAAWGMSRGHWVALWEVMWVALVLRKLLR